MNILVLNPGSATLKFGLYQIPVSNDASATAKSATVLANGVVERIGDAQPVLRLRVGRQPPLIEPIEADESIHAVEQIVRRILAGVGKNIGTPVAIDAVGCRVVHGGARFVEPTRVTPAVLEAFSAVEELAPLHIPADVAVLERLQQLLPGTPVIAVFDTAFHQTLPEVARTYALPFELCARYGLRRYGFHGISHAYVSGRLIELLRRGTNGTRIITCHLGSGASVCAVRDGKSIDTSMGLTPMEGLVMSTRSGDVDPGLVLYLIRSVGMTVNEVDELLNYRSGLLGLSGLSADLRELEQAAQSNDKRAELALEIFAYRTAKYIGAFAAVLEGLDAVAFTGGIGEHSSAMRSRICRRLEFLGLRLDEGWNRAANGHATQISAEGSAVQAWVIPTDEEREIAWSTFKHVRDA